MQARDIEPELKRLIGITSSVEPGLTNRLDELRRWIRDKKPGLLTSKRFVLDFLLELIVDAQTCLDLKALTYKERQEVFEQMTPTESYWYGFLFPQWFTEPDPKLPVWKQKMMAGEFTNLSTATDLVVSGRLGLPLCLRQKFSMDEWLSLGGDPVVIGLYHLLVVSYFKVLHTVPQPCSQICCI